MASAKPRTAALLALALLVAALAGTFAQQAHAQERAAAPATLSAQAQGRDISFGDDIAIYGVTTGTASYDPATRTLSLDGLSANYIASQVGGPLTVRGTGSLAGEGSNAMRCQGKLVLRGADLKVAGKMFAIVVTGGIDVESSKLRIDGGSVGLYVYDGDVSISKSNVTLADIDEGIFVRNDSFPKDGKEHGVKVSSGTLDIPRANEAGVYLHDANFSMTGGTVSITGAYGDGIHAYGDSYRGEAYGGKVSVTGGSFTCTLDKSSNGSAVNATSMSNKVPCLKKVVGRLAKGASFKAGKVTYRVSGWDSVVIKSYDGMSKKPRFSKARYGGVSYAVDGVASNAFKTKAGKKVTEISFADTVHVLGAGAFAGTASMTRLRFPYLPVETKYSRDGHLKSVKLAASARAGIDKKAFAKCGKGSGKGLTFWCGTYGVDKQSAKKYRAFLRKYGLPAGAKLKTY